MQELLANGNYTPYLAQAFMPPMLGNPSIGQQFGSPVGNPGWVNPSFGQFGQGLAGNSGWLGQNVVGQPGLGQQLGQPQQQQIAAQQQHVAAVLQQLAHQAATNLSVGQQIIATLQQIAQYCASQITTGYQAVQVLNQLAQHCASLAHATRQSGLGSQTNYGFGQPLGYGGVSMPFNQPQWGMGFGRAPW